MKQEVVYGNIQDLIGHTNREAKFNWCKFIVHIRAKNDDLDNWMTETNDEVNRLHVYIN
jgi:hypothetical protein